MMFFIYIKIKTHAKHKKYVHRKIIAVTHGQHKVAGA